MTTQRRSVLKGIGGTAAGVTLAGCLDSLGLGGDDRGAHLWHDFTDAEEADLERYLEAFNEERDADLDHDGVSDLNDQLNTAIPAGDGPTSFSWAHDWVGVFDDQAFLYDGADDVEVDLGGTFTDAAAEAVQYDGAVYGVPYGAETVTLLYNADMVDSAPETVDELVERMADHHDPEAGRYGLSYPSVDPYFVSAWVHAFGGFYYDEATDELGLEREETIEGVEFLAENFWEYVPADPGYEAQVAVFNDGNAPFAINGPWEVGGFRDAGIDVGVAPFPDVDGGEASPYTGIQMWYFAGGLTDVADDDRELTVDWAEWYATNGDAIIDNARNHGMIPVHLDYVDSDELGDDVEAFTATAERGIAMPTNPRMDAVWTPVENALERVFNGGASAEEALSAAADEIRSRWD